MLWVKVYPSLLRNRTWRRSNPDFKLTFFICLLLAGDSDKDGALTVSSGPITVAEIAEETGLPVKRQAVALASLVEYAFLYIGDNSTYTIGKWDEKAGEDSTVAARRERQRKYVTRKRHPDVDGDVDSVDNPVDKSVDSKVDSRPRKSTDKEEEVEEEVDKENTKEKITTPELPRFGDLEADVVAYVANAAAENKTGKIAPSRVYSLRRELEVLLGEIGNREAFAHGLRAANSKGAANKTYVAKAAANYGGRAEAAKPVDKYAAWRNGAA